MSWVFDLPQYPEWYLIETTNQKLQSANLDPIRHRQVALLEIHA